MLLVARVCVDSVSVSSSSLYSLSVYISYISCVYMYYSHSLYIFISKKKGVSSKEKNTSLNSILMFSTH